MKLLGKTVDVYWNVRKKLFSVRHAGKVVAHVESIALEDCRFIVREAGRQRVLATRRKNVHAWVKGVVSDKDSGSDLVAEASQVYYNPYKMATFMTDRAPVYDAPLVLLLALYGYPMTYIVEAS